MKTVDYIRQGLEASAAMTFSLIDDLKDAPLQPPTGNGGNPPIWILGHLTCAEGAIVEHVILGNDHPLPEWKEVFSAAQGPSADESDYPSWDDVRNKFDQIRRNTLAYVDTLTDDDLDNPPANCPPGREAMFGTIGGCLRVLTLHPMMHYGQLADSRRMLGRDPLNS